MEPVEYFYNDFPFGGLQHQTIDSKIVRTYANDLGIHYPDLYVQTVAEHGAMRPFPRDHFLFQIERPDELSFDSVAFFCHFIPAFDDNIDYVPTLYPHVAEWLGEERLVPFFSTSTTRWVCFDFRKTATEPTVVMVAPSELALDEPAENVIYYVARDFEDFMDGLITQEEAYKRFGLEDEL